MKNQIKVGTTFNMQHADANPEWTVIARLSGLNAKHVSFDCEIKKGEWKGSRKVMAENEIQSYLNIQNYWENLNIRNNQEWFAALKKYNLKPGDIVHDLGNKKFAIRCELQIDGTLKDVSIVGEVLSEDMPKIFLGGEKPEIFLPYYVGRAHKGESKIWANRISDFPELTGNFEWRKLPVNAEAMTLPVITREVQLKNDRLVEMQNLLKDFQYSGISFEDVKNKINSIK